MVASPVPERRRPLIDKRQLVGTGGGVPHRIFFARGCITCAAGRAGARSCGTAPCDRRRTAPFRVDRRRAAERVGRRTRSVAWCADRTPARRLSQRGSPAPGAVVQVANLLLERLRVARMKPTLRRSPRSARRSRGSAGNWRGGSVDSSPMKPRQQQDGRRRAARRAPGFGSAACDRARHSVSGAGGAAIRCACLWAHDAVLSGLAYRLLLDRNSAPGGGDDPETLRADRRVGNGNSRTAAPTWPEAVDDLDAADRCREIDAHHLKHGVALARRRIPPAMPFAVGRGQALEVALQRPARQQRGRRRANRPARALRLVAWFSRGRRSRPWVPSATMGCSNGLL